LKGVTYRKSRGKYGYDIVRGGQRYALFNWDTAEDAGKALRKLLVSLDERPRVPRNALVKVVNQYLLESKRNGVSSWRLEGLRLTFDSVIVPYFGATRSFTSITDADVSRFILDQKERNIVRRLRTKKGIKEVPTDRKLKNATIWHYITDLRALYNWAIEKPAGERLADINPVDLADLQPIRRRKFIKPPFDPQRIAKAATVLPLRHRVYYNFCRFTGSRKDEANRVEWDEHLFLEDRENAWYLVPGTKTKESAEYLPLHPEHVDELREWRKVCPSKRFVFPGESARTKGKKIYSRARMLKTLREKGYHVTVKDLRDYFINEVASKIDDPGVIMRLARHKSLVTTTKYLRTVKNRMQEAVRQLVVTSGCESSPIQGADNSTKGRAAETEIIADLAGSERINDQKFGGGGQTRTVDSADMSRVL
jgi:integrase